MERSRRVTGIHVSFSETYFDRLVFAEHPLGRLAAECASLPDRSCFPHRPRILPPGCAISASLRFKNGVRVPSGPRLDWPMRSAQRICRIGHSVPELASLEGPGPAAAAEKGLRAAPGRRRE